MPEARFPVDPALTGTGPAPRAARLVRRRLRLRQAISIALPIAAAVVIVRVLTQPRSVVSHVIARGDVVSEVFGSGTIASRRVVEVGFDVTGKIARLEVDQGDRVKAGQDLGALDDETFRSEVAFAEQAVKTAEASLPTLDAERARAEASLLGAQMTEKRLKSLPPGARIQQELDDSLMRSAVAVADVDRARAAKAEGVERLETAKRTLDRARALLAHTVLRSPFEGIVLRRSREVGDVAVPGTVVLKLAATDAIWASVWVDETAIEQLRPGQAASVARRSAPGSPIRGRVDRIGREVDRETRELLVDLSLEELPASYAIGQRADAWIETGRATNVLRVPPELIAYSGSEPGAYVLANGRARFRRLELGARGRDWVEVRSGLDAGAVVIRPAERGAVFLGEGARVAVAGGAP